MRRFSHREGVTRSPETRETRSPETRNPEMRETRSPETRNPETRETRNASDASDAHDPDDTRDARSPLPATIRRTHSAIHHGNPPSEVSVTDPSLAVAHGCFWKYHPAKAYTWELRLQDEIRPDFLIEEDDAGAARKRYLKEHKEEAKELVAKEKLQRERKALKADADDENPTEDVEERDDETQPLKRLHTARPRPSSAKPLPLKKARERTSNERKSGSRLRAAAKRVG